MDDTMQPAAVCEPERPSFESQTPYTPLLSGVAAETGNKTWRINLKMDLGLLPLLSLLYLSNGLDRGNVGNAQTQGFTDDIGARPEDLNLAVSVFFASFVLFQPLSAGVGWWLGPARWIPVMMMAWGVVTIVHAFIWGRGALIAARALIGVFEAGFYPTAVTYLATFYPRYDLAVRIALFYGQYAIASAFSGALSYAVFSIPHRSLKGWQLLFIIEGVFTCGLAVVAWVWLPRGPSTAWFLTKDERIFAAERVQMDSPARDEIATVTRRDVVETAKDWKLWFALVFNICASVPASAFSVFLPLVVQGMGYKAIEANLMSVPPAVCGTAGLYLFALSSDRREERGYHITIAIMIVLAGLIAVVTSLTSAAKYAALCVLLFGSYVPAPLTVAWLSGNTPAPGKRALVVGVNGWGNLAGIIGAQLYRPECAPEYREAFAATLTFVAAALVGVLAYRAALQTANRRRAALRDSKSSDEIAAERTDDVRYADRKWTFAYGL